MTRIQKVALAVSSAALCATMTAGCAALEDSPISNAKANKNPAIGKVNTYSEEQQQPQAQQKPPAKKDSAEAQQEVRQEKKPVAQGGAAKDPVGTRNDQAPRTQRSDVPAWVTAINWAQTKLGHKYVWGGESEEEGGYDCSGLMQAAYAQAGIPLTRVANDQYAASNIHPKKKDLRPGDLVFYGKTERGIHHVGLYVGVDEDGDQVMLHAPNSRSVIRFNKLNYMSDYYGATRIVQ